MANKLQQLNIDKVKALGELFVQECREASPNLQTLQIMLDNGAPITYNHAKSVYWTAKDFKFDALNFLVDNGALEERVCKTYISNICNYKNYKIVEEAIEPEYFAVMEKCVDFYGSRIDIFTPYIIYMAVHGQVDKLENLMKRYYLSEKEIAQAIPVPIILEIIMHNYTNVLNFINKRVEWITQDVFDRVVETGDWLSLEYIINNSQLRSCSIKSLDRAKKNKHTAVLEILKHMGQA